MKAAEKGLRSLLMEVDALRQEIVIYKGNLEKAQDKVLPSSVLYPRLILQNCDLTQLCIPSHCLSVSSQTCEMAPWRPFNP